MNARIQTWFPFSIRICLNGREWLARQLDRKGLDYVKHDNCMVSDRAKNRYMDALASVDEETTMRELERN